MNELKNQHEDTRFSSSEQGKSVLKNFKQQLKVANRTEQTVRNYTRSIEGLMNFLGEPSHDKTMTHTLMIRMQLKLYCLEMMCHGELHLTYLIKIINR